MIKLTNMKKYYKGLSNQRAAVEFLGNILLETPAKHRLQLLTADDWIELEDADLEWLELQISSPTLETVAKLWRSETLKTTLTDDVEEAAIYRNLPIFSQLDNPIKPHASCNSSAHAMMGHSIKPEEFPNDTNYVRAVYRGDYGYKGYRNPSIYWAVHVNGLRHHGIRIRTNSTGNFKKALAQANKGIATPINILHRGHISNPRGGHVICLMGEDKDDKSKVWIVDPYGELNYITGKSDLSKSGKYRVSKHNLLKRWQGTFSEYISHN